MEKLFFASLVIVGVCSACVAAETLPPAGVLLMADAHAEDHDVHEGERRELGSKAIAGYTAKVFQETDVEAGEEAAFAIVLSGGKGKPKAIRGWVGVQSAEGSVKTKAVAEKGEWHAHVEVPKPIPAKSQFWVEIEVDGSKRKVAFDYK